jgi:hypothetical protein
MTMKKNYIQPALRVVKIQQSSIICSSPVNSIDGNAGMNYGGGGSGVARGRSCDDWDEE